MVDDAAVRPPLSRGAIAFLALLIVLTVAVFAVFLRWSHERVLARDAVAPPGMVALGEPLRRPVAGGEEFSMRVSLEIDPVRTDRDRLLSEIEARRDAFRAMISQQVLGGRRDEDFKRAGLAVTLKLEIRDRVNRELAAAGLGQGAVRDVHLEAPAPRQP